MGNEPMGTVIGADRSPLTDTGAPQMARDSPSLQHPRAIHQEQAAFNRHLGGCGSRSCARARLDPARPSIQAAELVDFGDSCSG